jgi:hypothetical protein
MWNDGGQARERGWGASTTSTRKCKGVSMLRRVVVVVVVGGVGDDHSWGGVEGYQGSNGERRVQGGNGVRCRAWAQVIYW